MYYKLYILCTINHMSNEINVRSTYKQLSILEWLGGGIKYETLKI